MCGFVVLHCVRLLRLYRQIPDVLWFNQVGSQGDQKPTVHSRGESGEGLKEGDKGTDVEEWALSKDNGKPFPSQPEESRGRGDASEPAVRVSTGDGG